MKVAVMGGGSSYTPELINGFLERVDTFPMTELWLLDVLPERLDVVGGFAQRMVQAKGAPFKVVLSTDRRAAIDGASYVTTQLRVGWMEARTCKSPGAGWGVSFDSAPPASSQACKPPSSTHALSWPIQRNSHHKHDANTASLAS